MSSDPSKDKFELGPRVAELGIEEGITTREAPPFTAWEIAAKGSLVEITSGKTKGAVLVRMVVGEMALSGGEGVSVGKGVVLPTPLI